MKEKVKDFAFVTIGSLIAAIAYNTMFVENNIASGGVGGLAISLRSLMGWDTSNFVLYSNIPLLLICWFLLGKSTFIKTIYGAWIYAIFIKLTDSLPTLSHNTLLAAIFGGIVLGFGIGLVFLGNSSTGGTGIVVQVLNKYTPVPFGLLVLLVDGIIVGLGFIAFDADTVMYSILSLMTITYVINLMMAGTDSHRNVMVISQKYEDIKNYITEVVDRGVTEFPILGGYTGNEKRMLMITISRPELQTIEKEILSIDETAFIIVMPATQVRGRGFSLHKNHAIDDDILFPM
ncbi:YitT family protein [Streptococcus gallolyticus]|uniref:YitT family protein n=1 Tax=Streptococcus hepaticus TaxID=3349163 RepID=UPI001C93D403|nr:YitT family protein [Streptococcus gallolyticus]MBY5040795.1 YitT family protein [Streptococcus gallolyticus]